MTKLFLTAVIFFVSSSQAQNYISQTQTRRQSQRVSIYDWIMSNKKTIAAQNSKYGGGGLLSILDLDLSLTYRADRSTAKRDGVELGEEQRSTGRVQLLFNNVFSGGNSARSFNMDIGAEGFYSSSSEFKKSDTSTQLAHSFTETAGGLLIRPLGRSSQDTGLMVKGGYLDLVYKGLWEDSETLKKAYGVYLGAEAKLYLLPFLGVYGDYFSVLPQSVEAGRWGMYKFIYGAFLEIFLLNFQAYIIDTEMTLTRVDTTEVKEFSRGIGFGVTAHF